MDGVLSQIKARETSVQKGLAPRGESPTCSVCNRRVGRVNAKSHPLRDQLFSRQGGYLLEEHIHLEKAYYSAVEGSEGPRLTAWLFALLLTGYATS